MKGCFTAILFIFGLFFGISALLSDSIMYNIIGSIILAITLAPIAKQIEEKIRMIVNERKLEKLSRGTDTTTENGKPVKQHYNRTTSFTQEYYDLLTRNAMKLKIFLIIIEKNPEIIKCLKDTGEVDDTHHFLERCLVHDILQCVIILQNGYFNKRSLEAFGFYIAMHIILEYNSLSLDWENLNQKYKRGMQSNDIQIYYNAYSTNPLGYAVTTTDDDKVLDYYKRVSDFSIPTLLHATNSNLLDEYATLMYRFATIISKADDVVTENENTNLKIIFQSLNNPIPDVQKEENINIMEYETNNYEKLDDVVAELNELIGLQAVKEEIATLINFIKIQKERENSGLKTTPVSYHIVFTGNPGTGKTTVARIVAKMYKHLGILSKGHLVETDRSGLVAQYTGQTAPKVNHLVDSALDGILFIDEAYSLVGENQDDYGKEAVAALIKRMEDDRDKLVVILAGYTKEMEIFIDTNPGLKSRFNRYIEFLDFTPNELLDIFKSKCQHLEYFITLSALSKAKLIFEQAYNQRDKSFGNARLVRNLFEKTIEHQANRIAKLNIINREILTTIEADDIYI